MTKRIEPFGDFVVIKRAKPEERTQGGLVIPDTAQAKSLQGEVLCVGPGDYDAQGNIVPMPPGLFPGKVVLVSNRYTGTEVVLDGETFLCVRAGDIIGRIE